MRQPLSVAAQESRVDALVRIMCVLVLAFGAALIYSTNANASVAGQAPALVPIYYALGFLLVVAGFLATFAKFK
jgi:hypothetical protein